MKQIATIILVLISLTSFGQGGTKFTVKGNGSGGSNVGDSVKKNTDTLVIHNTRIIKNTDSLVSHNTRIGKNNDSLISHNTRIGAVTVSDALKQTKLYGGYGVSKGADSTTLTADTANGKLLYSRFQGLTCAVLGDSYVSSDYCWGALGQATGMTINRYGLSGSTITGNGAAAPKSIVARIDSVLALNPDVIIIVGGVNDWAGLKTLGNFGATDTSTFFGAWDYIFSKCAAKSYGIRVFATNQIQSGLNSRSSNYAIQRRYVDAFTQVANKYGYPIIDFFNGMGINYENLSIFSSDGVHLNNTAGKLRLTNFVINSVMNGSSIVSNNGGLPLDSYTAYNGAVSNNMRNITTGTAAQVNFNLWVDNNAGAVTASAYSSGFTTAGLNIAASGKLVSSSAMTGGMTLAANGANPVTIGTNNVARVITSGTGVTSLYSGSAVSSASTITPTGNLFHVTGTTTITSVSGTGITAGTTIKIIFDGILTFTDGSNLKLAGNFVTTADDTITLTYDGTSWYEMARSIN